MPVKIKVSTADLAELNVVTDGALEIHDGTSDFDEWGESGTVTVETAEIHDGSSAAKLDGDGQTAYIYQWVDVQYDEEYELAFYCKGDYYYRIYDRDVNLLESGAGNNADWTEITDTFTTTFSEIQVRIGVWDTELGYVDDITLIKTGDYSRVKFNGFIDKIRPTAGQFNKPVTYVECVDWIGFLNKTQTGLHAIETSKTADEALTTLLADFDRQPDDYEFDTGDVTFDYIYKGQRANSSMARAFHQLAWNEDGQIYCKGDGVLVFENSSARSSDVDPVFELDGMMSGLDISYGMANIYNIITLEIPNVKIDGSATTTLWEVEDAISVPAGGSLDLKFNYTDPSTGARISAADVVEPAGANLSVGANITVSDWTAGQDSATATFTNAGGGAENISTFTILGKGIYEYDKVVIEKQDSDSIWQVGEKRYIKRLSLITDPSVADTRAEAIRDAYGPSHIGSCKVTVCANLNNEIAKYLIEAEPSTKFTAIETATGVSRDFYIDKIQYKYDVTLLWATLHARVAED
jgi:hypothetical protein